MKQRVARLYCWLAMTGSLAASPAYLPMVGPPPLRFRAASTVVNPPTHQPALPLPKNESVSAETLSAPNTSPQNENNAVAAEPTASKPVPTLAPVSPPLSVAVSSGAAAPTNLVEALQAEDDVLSPRAFLQYFVPRTNGASASVVLPLNFVPPQPVSRPSSTATYSTAPPTTP